MKRTLVVFLAIAIALSASLVALSDGGAVAENSSALHVSYDKEDLESMLDAVDTAISDGVNAVTEATEALQSAIGDSYDAYSANTETIEVYYAGIQEIGKQVYATLHAIAIDYYKALAAQGIDDYDTWNDAMDDFYDAWDGGMDDFYDAWDDAYDDIYEQCDEIIDDASDQIGYSEYSDAWSEMYNTHSDAWSDMYGAHSDAWSDAYGDHSDVWSAFYRGKSDVDDILRLGAKNIASDSVDADVNNALQSGASATSTDEIDDLISKHIKDVLSALDDEFETLTSDVDTYQKYVENEQSVEAFYEKAIAASESLCASMRVYSADMARIILASDLDKDDMYDELDEIYDCVYDDAGDDIYDGIYSGILDDMYDAYYSGILEDRDDDIPYSDWSEIRSGAYRMWSDSRSATYRQWSDMRSDVYRFWSDLRRYVYRGDMDKAREKVEDFYADYAGSIPLAGRQSGEAEPAATDEPAPAEEPIPTDGPAPTETPEPIPEPTETPKPTATPEPPATPEPTMTPVPVHIENGAKGEDVAALQRRLIALGYLNDKADGAFGRKTQSAVKALQSAHGLETNGIVTENEMAAIQEDMRDQAERAIAVAMTNCQSTDVFTSDGNSYDTSKFHDYAYTEGMHAVVRKQGEWTSTGVDSWHVEDIRLQFVGLTDMHAKLNLDVRFDGNNYVLSGVTKVMGKSANLDSNDDSKLSIEKLEPSETTPYLTVSPTMLSDGPAEKKPVAPAKTEATEKAPSYYDDQERKDWINSQFSIWNGAHKDLEDLIKKRLNDERSYKHIETTYIDCYDQTMCDTVNELLSDAGYSQRVKIGDLFIMTEFSAKNGFNATIKSEAYGIASYQDNTIELIGIE